MSSTQNTQKVEKTPIYENENFIISTYNFTVPNGNNAGKVLNLVELKTIKKRWSDEIKAYYNQEQYITISENQFQSLLDSYK